MAIRQDAGGMLKLMEKSVPWPMRGHPVFKAMHATATCCCGCMEKWWRVKKGVALSEIQQQKAVNLIMAWIKMQMECWRRSGALAQNLR